MTAKAPLTEAQVQHFLSGHPGWSVEHAMLCRTFEAKSFVQAIEFVGHVAKLAEAADHHPDIDVRWRKVTLRFVTHDAGNRVTHLDARLADECSLLYATL